MPRINPSFLRDPDQAAELAALLEDYAEELEQDAGQRAGTTRSELARHGQTIARYRRWAAELSPETARMDAPAEPPVQIRPARGSVDTTREEATG
jgi:hypothetical protein